MNRDELILKAKELAAKRIRPEMKFSERDMVLENAMMELLDVAVVPNSLAMVTTLANGGITPPKCKVLMGPDPRLPEMPEKPTLIDFFKYRFLLHKAGGNHLLQSAKLAKDKGLSEKVIMACLLHDIAVVGLIRADHGYWGAQMVAPYVDEEVSWAIHYHQAVRYFADPDYDYSYPKSYRVLFGEDYVIPDYIRKDAEYAKNHEWYDYAIQVCVNDLYAFDPDSSVGIEEFEDIIQRNWKQPEEGLGFDDSPVAHMWRTMITPCNFL